MNDARLEDGRRGQTGKEVEGAKAGLDAKSRVGHRGNYSSGRKGRSSRARGVFRMDRVPRACVKHEQGRQSRGKSGEVRILPLGPGLAGPGGRRIARKGTHHPCVCWPRSTKLAREGKKASKKRAQPTGTDQGKRSGSSGRCLIMDRLRGLPEEGPSRVEGGGRDGPRVPICGPVRLLRFS